ncbi:hypothetical protein Ait01nite_090140 [Actinoplanes italicus]|uniref:Uncharacterized protein n=1 Tax=Actinoplanes italicus TaxID=113567 RepID=A0A2T0JDF1_9ACTN|nr:hypothetical protein [Actinoplanes italicus]PRX05529.1 hypothetical protein CLV67_1459 [Actinoplanes italicus]GIE35969.1 hypothetical protein Ait01nite_090140 [Actinoplanes italicus]
MIRHLALATAAAVAGGVLAPSAASADVRFDPATNTGFVDAEDVRKAFGWNEETLARNAPEVRFTHHVGKEAIFSVLCDGEVRAGVSHNPGSTSAGLIPVVTVDLGTADLSGFRLTGAGSGASSMNVVPEPGHPCPTEGGGVIRRATYVHTMITEALSAEFRDVQVYLTQKRTVSKSPPPADRSR